MPDIEKNFQLRTLRVVTLCFPATVRHGGWQLYVSLLPVSHWVQCGYELQ
jgi:hypothetical protein